MIVFGKEYKIVSEKDQKNKANTLYLYIENIDGVTYAKFGEAFKQTVWERYDATGYTQHSKQIKVWKSSVGDKPIHRLLRSMFTWAGNKSENPLNTNEAYIIKMYQWLPALDYTHPWNDEMLYEYFDLTEDEIKEIEQEIK